METALVAMDSDCQALSGKVIEVGRGLRNMEGRKGGTQLPAVAAASGRFR